VGPGTRSAASVWRLDGSRDASRITATSRNAAVAVSHAIHPDGGIWGPVAYYSAHNPGNTFTGNIWDDTGQPITPG
jgi:hypothetical protein